MILTATDIIDFEMNDLIVLLLGVGIGIVLAFTIYTFTVIAGVRANKPIVDSKAKGLTMDEFEEIRERYKENFKDRDLQTDSSIVVHCKAQCEGLVREIASAYFPNSKRPLLELSVDELLLLSVYVSNRLNEILDRKALRFIKKFKISTLVGMGDNKKFAEDSLLVKQAKEAREDRVIEANKQEKPHQNRSFLQKMKDKATDAVNVSSAFVKHSVRRTKVKLDDAKKVMKKAVTKVLAGTIDNSLRLVCIMLINITAEETYKVYSKSVFDKEVDIVDDHQELAAQIESDLKDVSIEEIDTYEEEDYGQKENN